MPPRIRKRILAARAGRATAPPRQVPGRSDSAILSLLAALMLAADKIIYAAGPDALSTMVATASVEHCWRHRTPQLC
jgi:hypothetical protein